MRIEYTARCKVERPHTWIGIEGATGMLIGANMLIDGQSPESMDGDGVLSCTFRSLPLLTQSYTVWMGMRDRYGQQFLCESRDVGIFHVTGQLAEFGLVGERADSMAAGSAPVLAPYYWKLPNGDVRHVEIRQSAGAAAA